MRVRADAFSLTNTLHFGNPNPHLSRKRHNSRFDGGQRTTLQHRY